jgi:hypothetical protein
MHRILFLLVLGMHFSASAEILTVKTGTWEITAKTASMPRPRVKKKCVTVADVAQLTNGPDKDDSEGCPLVRPPTIVGNKWSADQKCEDGRTVHSEFVTETQEKVSGTLVSTAPQGGPTYRLELSSRWIGDGCAGVK